MTTRITTWASMAIAVRFACAAAVGLLLINATHASILVGTVVTSGVESIPEINQLIADYNADFGATLPSVESLLDKIEGQDSADFTEGNLQLSDFDFYHGHNSGATNVNVFDAVVKFTPSNLGAAGFGTLDNRIFGFEQLSGPSFDYYVSKDGSLGWSLWVAESGINPSYTDAAGDGFTRGNSGNNALDYDPITRGVSHISFYLASESITAPEPSTLVLLGVATAALWVSKFRRRLG